MPMKLNDILDGAVKFGASDVHLSETEAPYLRVHGVLRPVQAPPLTHELLRGYVADIMPASLTGTLESRRGADFAYAYNDQVRYRVSAYYERNRLKMVLRTISLKIPTVEELDLPEVLKKISMLHRGMVLVTGATGSGKSTSLAAMIHHANGHSNRCLITIEDPIEFIHQNQRSIVTQREVGVDVPDFNTGLIQALRQDPDVILIGEMRDVDSMRIALRAAETGHLLFSTLHTTNAVQTIERILSTFPEGERDLIREEIAFNLKSVICQRLVRRPGGQGRIASMEILVVNSTVEKLIYENRIRDIPGLISGRQDGMRTFDQCLADLVRESKIDQKEAETACDDLYALRRFIRGESAAGESGGGIIAGF
ncbi:PilT/PilU family type 4a pilus ATPase [bacterium]|nr:PilT/PilU family type 4a pilus ATPase [bacterium]